MNPTIETMLAHRSIRRYRPDPIPEGDILRAVEAGQAASTSSAVQAYCVIRVRDEGARRRLVGLTGGQEKVASCGAFFVICGDSRRHRIAAAMHGEPYETRLEGFLLAVIDASLFAQNFALALESMGYGVCYIGGLRNDLPAVDALLDLPEGVFPLYGLCAGLPDESPRARPRLDPASVLFDDRYPDDDTVRAQLAEYDARYEAYLRERDGGAGRAWSAVMAARFVSPDRVGIGAYYRAKGADLA
ncbi:MAG: nitroreductase family protein [Phycisphaerales bacterium]